jgi:transposase
MSFRELGMTEIREVLRRWQAGQSARAIAREGVVDRKTATRYIEAAKAEGLERDKDLSDEIVGEVGRAVQTRPVPPPSEQRQLLATHRERIRAQLFGETPLRLVRVHELLKRDGIEVAYTTLRRFAHDDLGWRERKLTVRVDDPPAGEEAQIDFGEMGFFTDAEGRRRKLWVLVITLSMSRYMFVWPTFTQSLVALCEGLEAAWQFFGGVPKRVVPDNMTTVVMRAHSTDPKFNPSFLEYAQSRGFFIDPARVRRPQDKGRVENQVAYVRERWFDGERHSTDMRDVRVHAERWCRDVAGARVHGTTRRVPREVYEAEELQHMLALPETPFDVPSWAEAKIHPDHHAQVAKGLYSLPARYVGRRLRVRIDSTTVRFYAGHEVVKLHPRVEPGKRSTDPNDYPDAKSACALRSVDRLKAQAKTHGEHVGIYAERLLGGILPWTYMRQGYGLLRLCERYGSARVDALCARSLSFDVVSVPRIEGMLKKAQRLEEDATTEGRFVRLPEGRFARPAEAFTTMGRGQQGGGA